MSPVNNRRAMHQDLRAGYAAMAADEVREREARDWSPTLPTSPRAHD